VVERRETQGVPAAEALEHGALGDSGAQGHLACLRDPLLLASDVDIGLDQQLPERASVRKRTNHGIARANTVRRLTKSRT
jgi:hypothetical protein